MRLRQAVSNSPVKADSYADIAPIVSPIPADRQGAKRHYGVHPYFTRRPYNVVRDYILHYSRERDVVLDPFGGSGVTAIEAFLENRVGIQNDINPLANFIAKGVAGLEHGTLGEYKESLNFVQSHSQEALQKVLAADEQGLRTLKRTAKLPPDVPLPGNSDVPSFHQLFSTRQLIALTILKNAIEQVPSKPGRAAMLLALVRLFSKAQSDIPLSRGASGVTRRIQHFQRLPVQSSQETNRVIALEDFRGARYKRACCEVRG